MVFDPNGYTNGYTLCRLIAAAFLAVSRFLAASRSSPLHSPCCNVHSIPDPASLSSPRVIQRARGARSTRPTRSKRGRHPCAVMVCPCCEGTRDLQSVRNCERWPRARFPSSRAPLRLVVLPESADRHLRYRRRFVGNETPCFDTTLWRSAPSQRLPQWARLKWRLHLLLHPRDS